MGVYLAGLPLLDNLQYFIKLHFSDGHIRRSSVGIFHSTRKSMEGVDFRC